MIAEPNLTILSIRKLVQATLLENDLRMIKHHEILVQVTLPLLVALREEPIEVCQHVLVDVIKIVVCLQWRQFLPTNDYESCSSPPSASPSKTSTAAEGNRFARDAQCRGPMHYAALPLVESPKKLKMPAPVGLKDQLGEPDSPAYGPSLPG
ncbi:hypothetical protein C1H46_039662 [Malus baccata]|uniref:Uncharacterized protein n=1 Tax=Malus baccata TaxID=106549 RepID=A0A540KKS6_MALBA|nr:hypothetical protein C1H46_039662 [Malus baccata]